MPASYPILIQQAWCNGTVGGTVGSIAAIPAAPASPHASLNDGFPAITMTPASLGGLPPRGADMNGILNWITSFMVWANGGGQFNFSSTYATSPGYPVGAVIQLAAGNSAYVNIASGNIYDPNGGSPLSNGWLPWAGTLKANAADLANNVNPTLGSGMIDWNSALSYTSGTVGYGLNNANTLFVGLPLSTLATNGAGMVGWASGNAYAVGTVGNLLNSLNTFMGTTVPATYATLTNLTNSASASYGAQLVGYSSAIAYTGSTVGATLNTINTLLANLAWNSTQGTYVENQGQTGNLLSTYVPGVFASLKTSYSVPISATPVSILQGYLANFIGTLTLPANFFQPGKAVRIEIKGYMVNGSGNQNAGFQPFINGVAGPGPTSMTASTGGVMYTKIDMMVNATGVNNIDLGLDWFGYLGASSGVGSFGATYGAMVITGSGTNTLDIKMSSTTSTTFAVTNVTITALC